MNKKNIWILSGLLLVLIALIILVIKSFSQKISPASPVITENLPANKVEPVNVTPEVSTDKFKSPVPEGIKVPTANEVLPEAQKKEIAVPTVVVPAAPGVTNSFRNFNISGEGKKFVPSKIIASLGDTIHINFTAVDGDYDIVFPSYNMRQSAKKGETKILEFQALADGSFLYYCDSCGGPNTETKGNIIIVK